jgi:hypothetical protein
VWILPVQVLRAADCRGCEKQQQNPASVHSVIL